MLSSPVMVRISLEEDDDDNICEGCGTPIPAFLDGCPYCDDVDSETLPCPECGAAIHEDSEQCPRCGAWVTMGGARRAPSRWGLWIGLFIAALIALAVLSRILA